MPGPASRPTDRVYLGLGSPLRHQRSHTSRGTQADLGQLHLERGSTAGHYSQVVGVDVHGVDQVLEQNPPFSVVGFLPHGGDVDRGDQLGHLLEACQLGALGFVLPAFGVGLFKFSNLGREAAFFFLEGFGRDLVGVIEVLAPGWSRSRCFPSSVRISACRSWSWPRRSRPSTAARCRPWADRPGMSQPAPRCLQR
jgi:hypothetical protein